MSHLFKDIKFGDKFLTRDKRIAIFLREIVEQRTKEHGYQFQIEGEDELTTYNMEGKIFQEAYSIDDNDVIEEYDEDIVSKAPQYAYKLTRTIYSNDSMAHLQDKIKILYFADRKDAVKWTKDDHNKSHSIPGTIYPPHSAYVYYEIIKIKIQ